MGFNDRDSTAAHEIANATEFGPLSLLVTTDGQVSECEMTPTWWWLVYPKMDCKFNTINCNGIFNDAACNKFKMFYEKRNQNHTSYHDSGDLSHFCTGFGISLTPWIVIFLKAFVNEFVMQTKSGSDASGWNKINVWIRHLFLQYHDGDPPDFQRREPLTGFQAVNLAYQFLSALVSFYAMYVHFLNANDSERGFWQSYNLYLLIVANSSCVETGLQFVTSLSWSTVRMPPNRQFPFELWVGLVLFSPVLLPGCLHMVVGFLAFSWIFFMLFAYYSCQCLGCLTFPIPSGQDFEDDEDIQDCCCLKHGFLMPGNLAYAALKAFKVWFVTLLLQSSINGIIMFFEGMSYRQAISADYHHRSFDKWWACLTAQIWVRFSTFANSFALL
eukprot:SAG31_NODE_3591_length_4091_cov_3.159068_4_plen_386_part_00